VSCSIPAQSILGQADFGRKRRAIRGIFVARTSSVIRSLGFTSLQYQTDRARWFRGAAGVLVFVLLCVPALTRLSDHLDRHPFNAKPKFSFRKAAEEPPQKVYLDAAAVLSGGTPVQPDRSETQHIADFPALAGSVSRASAPLRAPPSSLLAV